MKHLRPVRNPTTEIERKYLVANDGWRLGVRRLVRYRQGYLAKTAFATVRVRCEETRAELTIKSKRRGIVRQEITYPIPISEAAHMLSELCGGRVLEKVRYFVEHDGVIWHVDVYEGGPNGLVVAEIELDRPDQSFSPPPWLGREISLDRRYRNSVIAAAHAANASLREETGTEARRRTRRLVSSLGLQALAPP